MQRLALKIDVDTYRGTRIGALRLADLLEKLDLRATFLFTLGPDRTGRAIRRAFRPGFFSKVRRTSVLRHYGLKTMLYGTVLPAPHIGKRCGAQMREIARRGFEIGVHAYDHVEWQDRVAQENEVWAHRELSRACDQYMEIFDRAPAVHGAAGWQMGRDLPFLEQAFGFRYASDTRGRGPFVPQVDGIEVPVPQLPTTLPTLDELIGRADRSHADPIDHLLALTADESRSEEVFTLHAELEGGSYLSSFEGLLRAWMSRGILIGDLGALASRLVLDSLPRCSVIAGRVPGRSGLLACQGDRLT